ncbi:MAG: ubiquinone/menaquinone biosynthesis methyltransferase [Planctomycetes bacterium]|nr:ubiquinone/menaquinone biosynthesis methyltransferase [Planctomycetota bacterium]
MTRRRAELLWDDTRLESPHAQQDKADRVRRMFDAVAPSYERINKIFSGGRDSYWRRQAVRLAEVRADDTLLDVCTGTGNFARAFADGRPRPRLICGCDFSTGMLARAVGRGSTAVTWCQGDGLNLPFRDGAYSLVSCAFGVRNFQDLGACLGEFVRILVPGGRAVILEFSRPRHRGVRWAYELYSARVMPWAATLVSGDRTGAYRYLPQSVLSFPDSAEMEGRLRGAGFDRVESHRLTFGVVTVYVAWKGVDG